MRFLVVLLCAVILNAAYLAAFADPTIFYMANVLLHLALGAVFTVAALWYLRTRAGWHTTALLILSAALGWWLINANTFENRWILRAHIAAGVLAVAAVLPWI